MADIHWQCQLNHLGVEKDQAAAVLADTEQLTVGEQFVLTCQGPDAAGIDPAGSTLELPKDQQYALKVLKNLGMDSHKAIFVATSYLVNPKGHQFPNIFLTDGKVRIALDGITFKVKSVITKENNPKNEPFPPWGPFGFAYPVWIWMGVAVLLVFFSSFGIEKFFQIRRRKKFLKLLASNPPVLSAYHQFSKDLRHLGRENLRPVSFDSLVAKKFVDELGAIFRWYLSRTLLFSCFDLSATQLLKQTRLRYPDLFKKVNHSLSLALIEVERLQNRPSQIKLEDAAQLLEMVRHAAEDLQKNAGKKSDSDTRTSRSRLDAEV